MIENFISVLQNIVHDITPEEIADILWLATHMDNEGETGSSLLDESNASRQSEITSMNADDLTGGTLAKTVEEPGKKAGLFPRRSGNETNAGLPFKVPAASALPGALDIGRALRPLMRKVPSQFASVIDEQATADRIAEEKLRFPLARTLWLPTLVPARRRWLEVALIIDTHSSMLIWQQTIFELQHLLEQQGAFRDVRSWKLVVDAQNASRVWLQTTADGTVSKSQKRRIEELLDPAGQRLFLIVTDCVSPLWQSDTVRNVVRTWGQNNPVTLIQMLPERFWRRTGLRMATPVRLKVPFPGAPNRSLQVISTKYKDDLLPEHGFSVPVVTLHPEALAVWARWLAGDAEASIPGFVLGEKEVDKTHVFEPAEVSAQQLVRRFRATASPIARKLAGLVAAAPVSLPVVHLIQSTMLPEARQVHVAELFLSGLLEQEANTETEHPDYIHFRFVEGVRDLLLDSMPTNETVSVLVKVSAFIQHRLGQSSDFNALLHLLSSDSEFVKNQQMQPFAFVMAKVLRRLGGEYVSLANKIEQNAEDITIHTPGRLNDRGISWSSSGEQEIEILPSVRKTFLDNDWCGLKWTKWIPFDSPNIGTLPGRSGIYRVKVIGDQRLMYIGFTARNVRERVRSLINNTMSQQMPFNDPHTAAPALWAWRDDTGAKFECSAASVSFSREGLEALLFYLLWQYRLEQGQSTFCNHGRFHPEYIKSGDRKTQNRGYRLPDGQVNPSGGPSLPPLRLQGVPMDSNWMGINWSKAQSLQAIKVETFESFPGIYKIIDGDTAQLLFIGSTSNLRNRLQQIKRRDWLCHNPLVSFAIQSDDIPSYQRHELENDLLGGYYEQTKTPPKFQFTSLEANSVVQQNEDDLLGRTLGDYQLTELLGQGGFGVVYLAKWLSQRPRLVSVKILYPGFRSNAEEIATFRERFRREARIIARLRHPHIVPIYDYGEEDDLAYIVMRYEKNSLASLLKTHGTLSLEQTSTYLTQICDALDYAHGKGIIHWDLKPSNILLDDNNQAMLVDFGISRIYMSDDTDRIGTPAYMAPEMFRTGDVDYSVDIYALGIILYRMLSGDLPFKKNFREAHEQVTLPPLHEHQVKIPRSVDQVLRKAAAKKLKDRYPRASELARDFQRAIYNARDSNIGT